MAVFEWLEEQLKAELTLEEVVQGLRDGTLTTIITVPDTSLTE